MLGNLPRTRLHSHSHWLPTAPVGGPPGQGEFLNGAAVLQTDLAAAWREEIGLVSEAFAVALRMAAPLVVAGLLVNLALGALNRLVPSFQVFFVSMPVQLLLSLALLLVSLAAVAHLALEILERTLRLISGV